MSFQLSELVLQIFDVCRALIDWRKMETSISAMVFLISASKALPLIDTGLGPPVAVLDTDQITDFAALATDRIANLTKGVIQKT